MSKKYNNVFLPDFDSVDFLLEEVDDACLDGVGDRRSLFPGLGQVLVFAKNLRDELSDKLPVGIVTRDLVVLPQLGYNLVAGRLE